MRVILCFLNTIGVDILCTIALCYFYYRIAYSVLEITESYPLAIGVAAGVVAMPWDLVFKRFAASLKGGE